MGKTTIIGGSSGKTGGPQSSKSQRAAPGVEKIDVTAVNKPEHRELYQKRIPIYPKLAHGTYRKIKWAFLFILLGIYYVVPFIRWDRGPGAPDQAVLADFAGRRFYFFFIEIWPQEVYYITGLLMLAAFGLFMATSLFGRVWCGYACPQTIWTDLFIAVERWVEGDRNARIKLARKPLRGKKLVKKIIKHSAWLLISFLTGGVFVLYFLDAPTVVRGFFIGQAPISAYLFTAILTFTTYTLAGTMREQVCTYMCPWPRIQGALTDEDSFEVTYRAYRGEPRGPHKKGDSWEGRGDCIDCKMCVAVCPMGIDIRDGDQLECINCALCIDACDDVMEKIGRPKGLIAYDTERNRKRLPKGEKPVYRLFRPRIILYAILVGGIAAIMTYGLMTRSTLDLNTLRDRSPTFVRLSDGSVRNGYTLKIINKAPNTRKFQVSVEGIKDSTLKAIGLNSDGKTVTVVAEPDKVRVIKIYVTVPAKTVKTLKISTPVSIIVQELGGGERAVNKTVFLSGKP
ncbi:MAG: cytochrome c oxidase accessory protein CcoG [Robiginitomaculum sp.]|nr:cytochrome c oxidase accessory protein CcoG [Robiginitomaculum sp.]MDQ7078299.1 cytochrome c oxidase accessory protein CcoG [Robiginitomaculum sp.]